MKALLILSIAFVANSAFAGIGSSPDCYSRTSLRCQSVDGRTVVNITQDICNDPNYPGDYLGGEGIAINAPSEYIEGNVTFLDHPSSYKLSSKETKKPYEINKKQYEIELEITSNFRGFAQIKSLATNTVVVDSEIVCQR